MAKNSSAAKTGAYHDVYLKKEGQFTSLAKDAVDFCQTWLKPVHPRNWDWTKRDFDNPKNDPTVGEARVIRDLILKDIKDGKNAQVDLSGLANSEAIVAFLNKNGPDEEFNMQEFAYALKVELEHGRIRDVNVTNNHPFLTAMIVMAHMSETVTYYKRLKVMELEGEIFELNRQLTNAKTGKKQLETKLKKSKDELAVAQSDLEKRLYLMKHIPVLEEVSD